MNQKVLGNIMNEEGYRKKLWEKVNKDYEKFKKEQLKDTKENIFNNAYKIAMLNDFTEMCNPYYKCLSLDEVKTLLKEKSPAQTLYKFYLKTESGSINDLYESIWYRLSDLVDKNKQLNDKKTKQKLAR